MTDTMMFKAGTLQKVKDMLTRYPELNICVADIKAALAAICTAYRQGRKLLVCGNGGSAADAEHIVGELMKGFAVRREIGSEEIRRFRQVCPKYADYFAKNLQGALPAISLVNPLALTTAVANDQTAELIFAQQVFGLGNAGDILLAITTSGNSDNVVYALAMARAKGMHSIVLTGAMGGRIVRDSLADIVARVPADETYRIQEYHIPVYHTLCLAAENEFFGV